jgi:outer membrane protein assembly factor BamB
MIAVGDAIFYSSSYDGRVVCLDAATGKQRWEFVAGAAVNRSPMHWDGKVYAGSDDGCVYCLDAKAGHELWKYQAAPTDRQLLAYGKMISSWPVRTDILVENGVAYFSAGVFPHDGTFVYALDANTGKLLWRNGTQCEDGHQLSLAPGGYLYVTAKDIWVPKDFRGFSRVFYGSPTPFRREDGVFVNGFGTSKEEDPERPKVDNLIFWPLYGVERNGIRFTGDLAWKVDGEEKARQVVWQNPIEGRWVDFDSAVGVRGKRDVIFRYDPDTCSVIMAGDTIYHAALETDPNKGVGSGIYARLPKDGTVLWSTEIPERANQLMVAGGRLFVGTRRGTIYCFASQADQSQGVVDEKIDQSPFGQEQERLVRSVKCIVDQSGVAEGYALVLDSTSGRLAYELARQTELQVVAVFTDDEATSQARSCFVKAGVHLDRVVAVTVSPGARLPFPSYFADLIVSEAATNGGELPSDISELIRMQKPVRGVAMIGGDQSEVAVKQWATDHKITDSQLVQRGGVWAKFTRGKLENGGSWTHFFADAGNTACSHDAALKPPLGVYWYGPPHIQQPGTHTSLVTNGILVVPEPNALSACDQYTGRSLWRVEFGSIGVSVAASDKHVYSRVQHVLVQFDLLTGKELASYLTPFGMDHGWGWFAVSADGKTVYGAAGGGLFATEMQSGKGDVVWKIGGPEVDEEDRIGGSIAMDGGRIYILGGAANEDQRADCIDQMRAWMKAQPQDLREEFESQVAERDIRELTAVEATTGKILFRRGVDISNCGGKWLRAKGRGYGSRRHYNPGVNLGMYAKNGVVVLASESRADKGWSVFRSGGYSARAITAYDGKSGKLLWYKFTNHRTRPVIIDDVLHAEPWAFDLRTGAKQQRTHPITGQQEDWSWCRADKQCGIFSASSNFLFGRNKGFGYHDLINDDGLYTFWHSRSNCFVDHVSGGGLMIKPPQAIYCNCHWSLPFTVAMGQVDTPPAAAPFFGQRGRMLPIKHLRLNLGGSGDRRDKNGQLWISPRGGSHWLLLNFSTPRVYYDGGTPIRRSATYTSIEGADNDFLFATCERGLKRIVVPATTSADGPGKFRVRLGFAALSGDAVGSRVFDVRINGQTVLADFDVFAAAGASDTAVWREFEITVEDDLTIDLVATGKSLTVGKMPILSAIEVIRQKVTGLGIDASIEIALSKGTPEMDVPVTIANLCDVDVKGRIEIAAPDFVKVSVVGGDRCELPSGERKEFVLRLSAVDASSDATIEQPLTVKLVEDGSQHEIKRKISLEWLGKYQRKIIKGGTTFCLRRGHEKWSKHVQPHMLINESLCVSRGGRSDGDDGQAITYLDFGTVGDIGKVHRVRLRLRKCKPGAAIHQALFGQIESSFAPKQGQHCRVARVEGDVADIRQIKVDELPQTSMHKVDLTTRDADASYVEAELSGPFKSEDRLRFALEPQSRHSRAFWNKSRTEWSWHPDHVPQLIIDYEAKQEP